MTKIIDLTGNRYGKLTVICKSEVRKRNIVSWDCVCDCGNTIIVTGQELRRGDTSSCGCNRNKGKPKDYTGQRRGSLVAVSSTGRTCNNSDYYWNFLCDCGNTRVMSIGAFTSKPHPSCKECGKKRVVAANTTHGFKQSNKVYKTWCKIKERCYCETSKDWKDYGAKGIKLEDYFLEDFLNFYNYIGEPPDNDNRWSIDRINHEKDYERGNIRWATDFQQARNKGMNSLNSSGVTGVHWDNKRNKNGNFNLYAVGSCTMYNSQGKRVVIKKSFPVKKYGLLPAFAMACKYREDKIAELNALGYGYTENHGK